MPKILITGASGLVGTRLQEMLLEKGYTIHTLGRSKIDAKSNKVKSFVWDISRQKIDEQALEGVDAIVHLAGAGVADHRWTDRRKKEILDSRVDSTRLLHNTLSMHANQVKTIVSASAVGYYGDCGADLIKEDHPPADSFLADVTQKWEAKVGLFENLDIRHVCCRIGIVLSAHGGALPELTKTLRLGIAGYFAKSPLYYPWVHIDDVCGIIIHGLENQNLRGSYNTTAPNPILIKELMKSIIAVKKSHTILTPVPPFAIKLALGEMAEMLLSSQRCSNEKIKQTGYEFRFPDLMSALEDIYAA